MSVEGFCPQCGVAIEADAVACPGCGSCGETGWSERARYEVMGVDYGQDEFDYDSFVKEEFGGRRKNVDWRRLLWGLVALGLIILFLIF
ncbi:MAG: hypothetical protein M2R45_00662 [Verrucomicrobia subdivision 3 bacterium]|nr:hypothetical protein [Limisphaerales bacterium]